jgi:hypothetical protein
MFFITEIILISLIVIGAIIYFIWHLRKELQGNCSCASACDSCKIRENCKELKSADKISKKDRRNQ